MRILFMGTPEFAVPSLRALVEAGHELCGVFTQPDKPKNRGMKLQPTPVKEYTLTQGVPVYQPVKLKDGTALTLIRELAPQLIAVAAYGRILPSEILDYPAYGCINVHSSLLPKFRGAAPIQWAVLTGEAETGVTIMHMAPELDAGDIIDAVRTPIGPDETAGQLHDRLALLGGPLLVKVVADIEAGRAKRTPQDHTRATLAPMLSRAMSPVDWSRTAGEVHNQIRGLYPWPAATAEFAGIRCKLAASRVLSEATGRAPGVILATGEDGIKVACGGGSALLVTHLQPDGGKAMTAGAFARGHSVG